jgi:hypothetical protein
MQKNIVVSFHKKRSNMLKSPQNIWLIINFFYNILFYVCWFANCPFVEKKQIYPTGIQNLPDLWWISMKINHLKLVNSSWNLPLVPVIAS